MEYYLENYMIPRIKQGFEQELADQSHCCGFCKHWTPTDSEGQYGRCDVHKNRAGFDCSVGYCCKDFSAARRFECSIELKVVEE